MKDSLRALGSKDTKHVTEDAETGRSDLAVGQTAHSDDPSMRGRTVYEKKAILVNKELASQGMGKYQWMIFFLCGFGYFLDLLWAQAFGLILASIQQEFGFSDGELGNLGTAFGAGLTGGAAFWGILGQYRQPSLFARSNLC